MSPVKFTLPTAYWQSWMLEDAARLRRRRCVSGRVRTNQADAKTVGIVVHLPGGREEHRDGIVGEKIGRAVRTIKNAISHLAG